MVDVDQAGDREEADEGKRSLGRRLLGTEERPTRLRKAWWVVREIAFLPWP